MFSPHRFLNLKSQRPDSSGQQQAVIRALLGLVLLFSLAGSIGVLWGGNSPVWGSLFLGIVIVSIYASWLLRRPYALSNNNSTRLVDARANPPSAANTRSVPLATTTILASEGDIPPAAAPLSPQKIVHLAKYRESKGVARPLRLLLVDDNRVNLKVMQTLFEKSGYSVMVADGGLAAIDMLDKHEEEIDAAIIDLRMPDLPGDQVVIRWRLLEKHHMPICILTADGREESQQASIKAGADMFMAKPLSVINMNKWLNSIASGKGLLAPRLEFKAAAVAASGVDAD